MKKLILALAITSCFAGASNASDLIAGPSYAGGWAGPYAGAFVSYDSVDHDFGGGGPEASGDYDGFGGGVFAGWNWQRGKLVYGVEGQLGYVDNTETLSGIPGPGLMEVGTTLNGSVRGRLGWDMGRVLPHISAGLSLARLETFWPGGPAERNSTLTGGVIGAGADIKVTERLFARAAYDFSFYGSETLEYCGGGCELEHDLQSHSVKLGIGIRF